MACPKHFCTETNENVRFIFNLLDDINKRSDYKTANNEEISTADIQNVVNAHFRAKDPQFSQHGHRLIHFIIYLNTELEHCGWVKTEEPSLNLQRYVHGKPLTRQTYYKLVEVLNLKSFISEVIMCTPYWFCRDLIDIVLDETKSMNGESQLKVTETLVVSLLKTMKRAPLISYLEGPFLSNFNEAMMVFNKDFLPRDIRRTDIDEELKDITRYNGFRVKSIFTIFIEFIKFRTNADTYRQYPMYKLKSSRFSTQITINENNSFKKIFDVIMYKCMNMCDFSVSSWLNWYEIEVIEEDTNLQTAIGHLCFELVNLIDKGVIKETSLNEFKPILQNIAIPKIDFTNVDITNIDGMLENIKTSPKAHLNGWIKKMVENHNVFAHSLAIEALDNSMEEIDYNCFKRVIDHCMSYHKSGGIVNESLCYALYKGIQHLDVEDKMKILRHVIINYPETKFYASSDFDNVISYIAHNEYSDNVDRNELMSKLIWLVIQQPRKMFHLLISQYITGICGLPAKRVESKRSILHQIMVFVHLNMHSHFIFLEYIDWLSFDLNISEAHKTNLRLWILGASRLLRLMKPKLFLANVISPLLNPSPNYDHMLYLMNLTKYFLAECQLTTQSDIEIWDELLIKLAKILEDARWNINNYSSERAEVCEKVIMTIQPLLHYPNYTDLVSIKEHLSNLSLMTRSHFLRLWTADYITIDGMDEQFIMTIQSQSHISYSNLNRSSTQKAQEEFIFSIATYMPRFTLHETKSFLANYLSSAKIQNVFEASFFLLDCYMNALMRIIVYLKIAVQNDPFGNECAWNYLENAIINFLDAVNTSKMCSIYDEEANLSMALNSITKIVMVIKQMENSRQMPLLVVARRLIELIIPTADKQTATKMLAIIASMKSTLSKTVLGSLVNSLMVKLELEQTPNPKSSKG